MTVFDLMVIAVIGLSTAFAVVRGALKEIGTLVVLAGAVALALLLLKPLQAATGLGQSFITTAMIGGGLSVVAFLILYFLLHRGLERLTLEGRSQTANRIGGGVFGFLRGLALIGLGFLAYSYYLDADGRPAAVKRAMTLPMAQSLAQFFEGFAPADSGLDAGAAAADTSRDAAGGYARGDRSALAEIVATATTSAGPAAKDEAAFGDDIAAAIEGTLPE